MNQNVASSTLSLAERIEAAMPSLSPAEQRMAAFFVEQREVVLLGSAAQIAAQAGASDATVVRTAKSLGFDNLLLLREALLADLTGSASPGRRLRSTLDAADRGAEGPLDHVLAIHQEALSVLASPEFRERFDRGIEMLAGARHRHIFGIGPSGSVAEYAARQFKRIGLDTHCLGAAGIGLADQLMAIGDGDLVMMIAYAPVYREVSLTLDFARERGVKVLLVSDSLGPLVADRVAEILPVPRGRADHLSMHAGTMVLIEAMIVALAARDRERAIASLEQFGALRGSLDKLWLKRGIRR